MVDIVTNLHDIEIRQRDKIINDLIQKVRKLEKSGLTDVIVSGATPTIIESPTPDLDDYLPIVEVLDEDDMVSDDDVYPSTQQAVKAFVEALVAALNYGNLPVGDTDVDLVFGNKHLHITFVNPTTEGGLILEGLGNFSGKSIVHLHQHTGNVVSEAWLRTVEWVDAQITPERWSNDAGTNWLSFKLAALSATRTLTYPDKDLTFAIDTAAEAVTAMGVKGDANPLNHDQATGVSEAEAIAAVEANANVFTEIQTIDNKQFKIGGASLATAVESEVLTAITKYGILEKYGTEVYVPHLGLYSTSDNPTKPKTVIYTRTFLGLADFIIGTSDVFATGITNQFIFSGDGKFQGRNIATDGSKLDTITNIGSGIIISAAERAALHAIFSPAGVDAHTDLTVSGSEIEDLLSFSSGNVTTIQCIPISEVNSTGHSAFGYASGRMHNILTGATQYITYLLPLPTNRGALQLYITLITVSIYDGNSGTNRVNLLNLVESDTDGSYSSIEDTGAVNYYTGANTWDPAASAMGAYDGIGIQVRMNTATQYALDLTGVFVAYYYA